jgi:hypothetical protein
MSAGPPVVEPTLQPPVSGVTVRMYNPGFGDCLLLAFRGADGLGRYVLIDFGVHPEYRGGESRTKRMQTIAGDIAAATGYHLHVVAATHEHSDHVYGFKYASDTFERIEIDEVWLAWTENPTDPLAKELKETYGPKLAALDAAVNLLGAAGSPLAGAIHNLLGFECVGMLAATGGKVAQLDWLRQKGIRPLQGTQDYRLPGEPPLAVPGVPGVKVYVLGPPRDKEKIKVESHKSEAYAQFAAGIMVLAADLPDNERRRLSEAGWPFDRSVMISVKVLKGAPEDDPCRRHFQAAYGISDQAGQGPAWRRIETDWLAATEQLALNLVGKTNNTSLVLAIELPGDSSRPVLLFAGDAQISNWLSWQDLHWPGEGLNGAEVSAKDLLERTVLYKVGHHGSLNATPKSAGLEQMGSGDLVAMLPVDEIWAKTVQGWEHPARKVLARLVARTKGRILRSDVVPTGDEPPERPEQEEGTEWCPTAEQWQAFVKHLDWDRGPDRLWIQYTVEYSPA